MRIAILTDVHANLPALLAALAAIKRTGCDEIIHLGDAIGIGPQPAECLNLLLNTPNLRLVLGNHDAWFAFGLPEPQPAWMSDGERAHHEWTHTQIDPSLREVVSKWPLLIEEQVGGMHMVFVHYALNDMRNGFQPIQRDPTAAELDELFTPHFHNQNVVLVGYGHHHPQSDVQGRARYVNSGACGCHSVAEARYAIVVLDDGTLQVEHRWAAYDDEPLVRAFQERRVPEREFLAKVFFGGRFEP